MVKIWNIYTLFALVTILSQHTHKRIKTLPIRNTVYQTKILSLAPGLFWGEYLCKRLDSRSGKMNSQIFPHGVHLNRQVSLCLSRDPSRLQFCNIWAKNEPGWTVLWPPAKQLFYSYHARLHCFWVMSLCLSLFPASGSHLVYTSIPEFWHSVIYSVLLLVIACKNRIHCFTVVSQSIGGSSV